MKYQYSILNFNYIASEIHQFVWCVLVKYTERGKSLSCLSFDRIYANEIATQLLYWKDLEHFPYFIQKLFTEALSKTQI